MPLTAAERMKNRRERLKNEGKYEAYKNKHAEIARKSRAKKKAYIDSLPDYKKSIIIHDETKKMKKRVEKFRQKKKDALLQEHSEGLTSITPQALGKATARVRRVLPKCTLKRKLVLEKLIRDNDLTEPSPSELNSKKHSSALNNEVIFKIKTFYERDDISRQAPGLKDFVSIRREDHKKQKVQIRHLYNSLSETHALFTKEHGVIVGKSKFSELRPKHVYLSNKLPHNVCLCKYHENYILALNSLHNAIKSPRYCHEFIEAVICDNPRKECWLNSCDVCKTTLENNLKECEQSCVNLPVELTWYVWRVCDGKLSKVQETGTTSELIKHILELTPSFFEHSYVKRCQADSYNNDKSAISSNRYDPAIALVQVDFSENFTCIAQDEVQSFHWVQPQVTLFTVSIWFNAEHYPLVIVSDDRHHDKKTSVIYIDKVLKELPETVREVHIWSDGPNSQFKNKYIAESLKLLEQRNKKRLVWNYFATSHGKGPVDGIGGALKRVVRSRVIDRKAVVFNAEEFAEAAKDSSVKVINCSPDEIEQTAKEMNLDVVFSNAPPIKGISKCHIMFWLNGVLHKAETSNQLKMNVKEKQSYYQQIYGSDSDSDNDNIPLALLK